MMTKKKNIKKAKQRLKKFKKKKKKNNLPVLFIQFLKGLLVEKEKIKNQIKKN